MHFDTWLSRLCGKLLNLKRVLYSLLVLPSQGLLHLGHLEELFLADNCLSSLEGIERLSHLKCLDVSRNNIRIFPTSMDQLGNLLSLAADHNLLQQLQPLCSLKELTQLFLSHNQISKFG